MTQLPGILSKSPLMGSLCPSSLCHPLMNVSEVLKHTWSHSMVTSRKPKSCHCQSRHCICVVKNAGERMSSSSSAKVILLKLVQLMEAEFLFFFFFPLFPSVLVQAAVPAHSDFWEFCSDPSCVRTSPPPAWAAPSTWCWSRSSWWRNRS